MGMKLLVLHPQILGQTCQACRRWVFDEQHRKLLRARAVAARGPGARRRPAMRAQAEPRRWAAGCERELRRGFSTRRQSLLRSRASSATRLSEAERRDALTMRNLAIVDLVVRQLEASPATATNGTHSLSSFWRN